MIKPIAVNNFSLSGNEKKYINECIDSGWISSEGPFIEKFEGAFSQYIGRQHGIAVSSGSAALDIAVKVIGIGEGDEVIMPAFTIISPALSVVRSGGIPVLVDSDPLTWNMDVDQLEAKITNKTKAIIVVHIYGLPSAMDAITAIAEKYNLKIIEDASQMHGQTYKGKKCGSFGDISIFSFYPNKHITTGEGGMILVDDGDLANKCKKLRNLAFEADGPRFVHHEMGWNYRMTNMQAAVGLAQLEQIDDFIIKKRAIGKFYNENINHLTKYGFQLPLPKLEYANNIYWVYGLVAPNVTEKIRLNEHLKTKQIGFRPFFWCMHEQPVFNKMKLFLGESYPVAENLARTGTYIPSGLGLLDEELKMVAKTISEIYG